FGKTPVWTALAELKFGNSPSELFDVVRKKIKAELKDCLAVIKKYRKRDQRCAELLSIPEGLTEGEFVDNAREAGIPPAEAS
ncbi:hypothetical protein KIPB_016541, partial [Kipferlia bialata]